MKKITLFILVTLLYTVIPVSAEVTPTNEWMSFWSDSTYLDGSPVQPGDIIDVYDPDGIHCGTETITSSGTYPLTAVYRDDPLTSSVDEGAEPGDSLTFKINGNKARPYGPDNPFWTFHGDVQKLNLVSRTEIPPVSDLRASVIGENILLEWSPMQEATEYNVYRDTTYNFEPDKVNGTNRIAEKITDQYPGTEGVQWTDTGNGADIVGDVNTNYFYRVTGFIPGTGISSRSTPVDYTPSGTPHTALGRVYNYDYSIPADTDILFEAYIIGRSDEVLTESSFGCGYESGFWIVEVGNFPTEWVIGETLHVDLQNIVNSETGSIELILTSNDPDEAEDVILSTIVESEPSNVAGEFDYLLITTPLTDINRIVVTMDTRMTLQPVQTAEELANAIPNCTVVYYWDAQNQGSVGHPKGLPINNFPVYQGYPYTVNVTADTVWTVAGKLPDTTFNLITTAGTNINQIGIPLSKNELINAEELADNIPNCTVVYKWDTNAQASIGHPKGLPLNNFNVSGGHAYFLNVTENVEWPESSAKKTSLMFFSNENKLKYSENSGENLSVSNIPHMVCGIYSIPEGIVLNKDTFRLMSWIKGREEELMTDKMTGAGIEGYYWWVGVDNFPTSWSICESLNVVIEDPLYNLYGETIVILSAEGYDLGNEILVSTFIDKERTTNSHICKEYKLFNNYPNPFNSITTISYYLPEQTHIKMEIFDLKGEIITKLLDKNQKAGQYIIHWDGLNSNGYHVVSGVYLYRLQTSKFIDIKKMLLIK